MVAQIDMDYIRTRPSRLWSRLVSYFFFEGRPLTTRGRWINIIVFGISSLLCKLPKLKNVEAPVFILGTGRSGTTILGIVLSMHRDIGFLNEPKAIWATLHEHDDLIGSYQRGSARYRLLVEDTTPSTIRAAHRIYGGYLFLTRTNRVVEKYPELIFRTEYVRTLFPDAKFLFLSRHGKDTCSSISNWSERLGAKVNGETHDWWGVNDRKWHFLRDQLVPEHPDLASHIGEMESISYAARAAVEWIVTMREGMRLAAEDGMGTLHVPYEMLCANPSAWAKRIEDFLLLPHDAAYAKFAAHTLTPPKSDYSLELPEWLIAPFEDTQTKLDEMEQ